MSITGAYCIQSNQYLVYFLLQSFRFDTVAQNIYINVCMVTAHCISTTTLSNAFYFPSIVKISKILVQILDHIQVSPWISAEAFPLCHNMSS